MLIFSEDKIKRSASFKEWENKTMPWQSYHRRQVIWLTKIIGLQTLRQKLWQIIHSFDIENIFEAYLYTKDNIILEISIHTLNNLII